MNDLAWFLIGVNVGVLLAAALFAAVSLAAIVVALRPPAPTTSEGDEG